MTKEQDSAIFAAYLGIGVLYTMCRAAKLTMAEERAKKLQLELDTAFPGLAGRSALRCAPDEPEELECPDCGTINCETNH